MRTMRLTVDRTILYESRFDPKTGVLVRVVEELRDSGFRSNLPNWPKIQDQLRARFPDRYACIPSPSPELVDVSITDKCGFGCEFCYQDSTPKGEHAPVDLIPTMLKGFDFMPYQIAIGGGEPTGHPEFTSILQEARKLGTVPNYTTAGHIFKQAVIDATNKHCGGVAITYHSFKGLDWFETTFKRWREALTCQLNIHLIADKNVVKNLDDLVALQAKLKTKLNVVLLAYYPDVGRATMDLIMTRRTYTNELPASVRAAVASGMGIAFSEGLLPFFLSRPEIVNTTLATRSEGIFSCYVDPKGYLWNTSFHGERIHEDSKTLYEVGSQKLWNELRARGYGPSTEACFECPAKSQCSAPHPFHAMTCARGEHNRLPMAEVKTYGRLNLLADEDE